MLGAIFAFGLAITMAPAPASAAASGTIEFRSSTNGTISRDEVINRARTWLNPPVDYSMSPPYHSSGYRRDCSGYVSMAWQLSTPGLSTVTLPDVSHRINKDELEKADIIMNGGAGSGGANGHVVIFEKWADSDQTSYWAYEQTPPHTVYRQIPYPYFSGDSRFVPYRYDNIVDSDDSWHDWSGAMRFDPAD